MDNSRHQNKGRNTTAMILLALLLFAMNSVFAQGNIGGSTNITSPSSFRTLPWELTTIVAILASFSIVAIAYMISKGLRLSELNGWARNEAYQLIAMVIFVFFIFSVLQVENTIFESFGYTPTPSTPNPAIASATNYLSSVRLYVGSVMFSTYVLTVVIQMVPLKSKITDTLKGVTGVDIGDAKDELVDILNDTIGTVNESFGAVLGLTYAQAYLLDLINRVAFTILLPIGLFLRVFSFSRGMGTFFISIAIAFYLVYPITFILNEKIVDQMMGYQDAWKDIITARALQSTTYGSIYQLTQGSSQQSGSGTSGSISSLVSGFNSLVYAIVSNPNNTPNAIFTYLNPLGLLNEGAFAFVLFTLIPIFDFVITLGVSREIGSLLGADVSFGDLLKSL